MLKLWLLCDEYKKVKIKEQDFSLLHLNISSLSAHINELKTDIIKLIPNLASYLDF